MSEGRPAGDSFETWQKLLAELPSLSRLPPLTDDVLPLDSDDLEKLRKLVRSKLQAADPSASQGVLGSGAGLWKPLLAEPIDSEAMIDLLVRISIGAVPSVIKSVLMYGDLIALPRSDDRVRPVVVPSFLGKTGLSALMALLLPLAKAAAGPMQLGIGTKDGATLAFQTLKALAQQRPNHVVVSFDAGGAHSRIHRDTLDPILGQLCRPLQWVLRAWYGRPSRKLWRAGTQCRSMDTETGLDQGHPPAAALFCVGLRPALDKLKVAHPDVAVVAFQDDIYLLLPPESLDAVLQTMEQLLGELGLTVNRSKLAVWLPPGVDRRLLPAFWSQKCTTSLKVLGQRLQVKLAGDGLPFLLGEGDPIPTAMAQLRLLHDRLRALEPCGLSPAVAHRLWLYASTGAITHLLASSFHSPDRLSQLEALQSEHLAWITERQVDAPMLQLARLPPAKGGIGLPSPSFAAPALFLAAQSRILPAIARILEMGSAAEVLNQDPTLRDQVRAARAAVLEAGCRSHQAPFGPAAPSAVKKASAMTRPLQQRSLDSLRSSLPPLLAARLLSQASAASSGWLQETFPGGEAKAGPTWRTMIRQRLLLPAPGSTQAAPGQCGHRNAAGEPCPHILDDSGAHEFLCNIGGAVDGRHDGLRDWVADKVRDAFGCRVATERPVQPPLVKTAGRMDVVCWIGGAPLLVDVVVPSCTTTDAAEIKRRMVDPTRAIRVAERKKKTRYGDTVLAVAVEDTGRVGSGAQRLLRQLAAKQEDEDASIAYRRLLAEMQYVVLSATAVMLQGARGALQTAM